MPRPKTLPYLPPKKIASLIGHRERRLVYTMGHTWRYLAYWVNENHFQIIYRKDGDPDIVTGYHDIHEFVEAVRDLTGNIGKWRLEDISHNPDDTLPADEEDEARVPEGTIVAGKTLEEVMAAEERVRQKLVVENGLRILEDHELAHIKLIAYAYILGRNQAGNSPSWSEIVENFTSEMDSAMVDIALATLALENLIGKNTDGTYFSIEHGSPEKPMFGRSNFPADYALGVLDSATSLKRDANLILGLPADYDIFASLHSSQPDDNQTQLAAVKRVVFGMIARQNMLGFRPSETELVETLKLEYSNEEIFIAIAELLAEDRIRRDDHNNFMTDAYAHSQYAPEDFPEEEPLADLMESQAEQELHDLSTPLFWDEEFPFDLDLNYQFTMLVGGNIAVAIVGDDIPDHDTKMSLAQFAMGDVLTLGDDELRVDGVTVRSVYGHAHEKYTIWWIYYYLWNLTSKTQGGETSASEVELLMENPSPKREEIRLLMQLVAKVAREFPQAGS